MFITEKLEEDLINLLYFIALLKEQMKNVKTLQCKNVQSVKQKKRNILVNFKSSYSREMKIIPINMEYCLL